MARIARLGGALLAETEGTYFLIGNTKQPTDFPAAGFEKPVEIDPLKRPYLALVQCASVELAAPWLTMDLEGEELARVVARCFLIERNGSVSERLWRLVTNPDEPEEETTQDAIDANWLGHTPAPIWQIVRDTVLRCT